MSNNCTPIKSIIKNENVDIFSFAAGYSRVKASLHPDTVKAMSSMDLLPVSRPSLQHWPDIDVIISKNNR